MSGRCRRDSPIKPGVLSGLRRGRNFSFTVGVTDSASAFSTRLSLSPFCPQPQLHQRAKNAQVVDGGNLVTGSPSRIGLAGQFQFKGRHRGALSLPTGTALRETWPGRAGGTARTDEAAPRLRCFGAGPGKHRT
jgi:hypothetical protein